MAMESASVFKYTFAISIVVHGFVFLKSPHFSVDAAKKPEAKMEFNYIKDVKKQPEKPLFKQAKAEALPKLPSRIVADNRVPPPFGGTDSATKPEQANPARRSSLLQGEDFVKRTASVKNTVSLSSPDANISKNPAYIGYYQISREKIRRCAYQQNYGGREEGEVTVSFVIAKDGSLRQVRLVEAGSCRSAYLREIAVSSVKEAAPFPAFPKELDYPQIPFTLTITFQS